MLMAETAERMEVASPPGTGRPRLLLVEDNRADAALVGYLLRDRFDADVYEVIEAGTLAAALASIGGNRFACVLLDLGLPDADGMDTVRAVRAEAPELPLVVLTGHDDEQLGIESLHCGAQDYLVKGQIDGRLLTRAISFAIERARMERGESGGSTVTSLPFDMSF